MKVILRTIGMIIIFNSSVCFAQTNQKDISMWLAIKLEPIPCDDPEPLGGGRYRSCADHRYSGGTVTFQDGKLDISAFVERAETLLRQSDYQNSQFFQHITGQSYFIVMLENLCDAEKRQNRISDAQECKDQIKVSLDEAEVRLRDMQADRILLPDNYSAVGELDMEAGRLALPRQRLRSNCLSACYDKNISSILSHGTRNQYQKTLNQLSQQGPSCLKKALATLGQHIAEAHSSNGFPDNCNGRRGRQREICNKLLRDKRLITERLTHLTDLVMSQSPSQAVQDLNVCLENESSISSLIDTFEDLDNEIACSDYQRGEERHISVESDEHYKIKKENDGSYTASLAITFSPAYTYDGQIPAEQIDPHFKQITQNCLDQANPKMLGPHGEQLNIVITDNSSNSCLPSQEITIQASNGRSNASSWEADINCPTITHELEHKLGLSDSYEEKATGHFVHIETGEVRQVENIYNLPSEELPGEDFIFRPAKNCRVTQDNSIMSSQTDRWHKVFHSQRGIKFPLFSINNAHIRPSDFRENSLLDPAHFHAILYGNCKSREDVRIYRTCSQLSLQTGYHGNTLDDDCPSLKRTCEMQNVRGRTPEQLQKDSRVLNFQLRSQNALLNRNKRNLITLDQAAVQTGTVDGLRFGCSFSDYAGANNVDISVCKDQLRRNIEFQEGVIEDLTTQQKRLRDIMSNIQN